MTRDEMHNGRRLYEIGEEERETLKEKLRRALAAVDGLAFAYLFGSFAESGPFHDVDVAIHFGGIDPAEADRRAEAAAPILARVVPFPLDLVALDGRPVTFRFHVYRGDLLLARDEPFLDSELEQTMSTYFDMEPVLRRATIEAFSE